jgi:arylsulfatase A-like enzyme
MTATSRHEQRSRARWITASTISLCALASACARRERPGIPPKNLIIVTIENLRADHLGCYGYARPTSGTPLRGFQPDNRRMSFDELAQAGVLFSSAYAPSGSTMPALASLFTGRGPLENGVLDDRSALPADVPTLSETLHAAGFRTGACITHERVPLAAVLLRGFEGFDIGADDVDTLACASRWLQQDFGDGRPFFLWIHLAGLEPTWPRRPDGAPHDPSMFSGRFLDPSYRGTADGSREWFVRVDKGEIHPTPADVTRTVDLYDGEVAHALGLLRELFTQAFDFEVGSAEATECWSRTAVVLTSPHGMELFDHGRFGHVANLHEEVLRVPLVLRHPDSMTGERVLADPVELADVMPTVLDWFGVAAPDGVTGRSLLARTDAWARRKFESRPAIAVLGTRTCSVRTPRWRMIWSPHRSANPEETVALFDCVHDPWEARDVSRENPDAVAGLEREVSNWRAMQISRVPEPMR